MAEFCPTCGQKQTLAHKEQINAMKVNMLKKAARHVMTTMKNEFRVRDFATPEQFKTFNNFQKLRYHGLVAQAKSGKSHWLITRNGWAFLRGELELPQYVLVKNNHITSRADLLVNIRDVIFGDPTIQTTFAYFDDDGNAVGFRPTPRPTLFKQVGLEL